MEKPPDGYIVFCKRACETCATVVPAMKEIAEVITPLTIYSQDDPGFPEGLPGVVDDTALETSFHFDIETVPTLIRMEDGQETGRAVGWDRAEWRTLTGMEGLGGDLPEFRPGCGAKNVEPGIAEELKDAIVPKFRQDGLHIVHAGGTAGLFSAIIGGWVASGPKGSQSVTKEVRS